MSKREENDWYVEDEAVTQCLIEKERFFGYTLCDPCCGQQNILKVFSETPSDITGVQDLEGMDIVKRPCPHEAVYNVTGRKPNIRIQNFLEYSGPKQWDSIVCNPPFKDAQAFIEKALSVTRFKVCAFLRLAFLEGKGRQAFYEAHPLTRLWVSRGRAKITPGSFMSIPTEQRRPLSSTEAYAWFVFEHGRQPSNTHGWF